MAPHLTPRLTRETFGTAAGFRETLLVLFAAPGDSAALRRVGNLLHLVGNECRHYWPDDTEEYPRPQLRAALADLRYLEGYLGAYLGDVTPFAAELAEDLRPIADRLDAALRTRRRFQR
jgi:hypothetical protein